MMLRYPNCTYFDVPVPSNHIGGKLAWNLYSLEE
jgi:hypothetical protein